MSARRNREAWRSPVGINRGLRDRYPAQKRDRLQIDQVRRNEAQKLRAKGDKATLKHTRWVLLKRKENLTGPQFCRLKELLKDNTETLRGHLLKEQFQGFWSHKSTVWAGKFLDHWISEAVGTGLEPFRRLGKSLHAHRSLLLNWFRAREKFAAGAVEGFNLKARATTRMAYGSRRYDSAKVAPHRLGNLHEPDYLTHKFT